MLRPHMTKGQSDGSRLKLPSRHMCLPSVELRRCAPSDLCLRLQSASRSLIERPPQLATSVSHDDNRHLSRCHITPASLIFWNAPFGGSWRDSLLIQLFSDHGIRPSSFREASGLRFILW
jgi:hypothetical protein